MRLPFLCRTAALAATLLLLPLVRAQSAPPVPPLAGTWRILPKLGTDLTPWQSLELVISVDRSRVTIEKRYAAGHRETETVARLDLSQPVSLVPISWWPDNRHIGAYIGGDRTERVRARWLEGGRTLHTDAGLVLDTEQGSHQVEILTDYTLSASGDRLTEVQQRSTRELPITYVYERANASDSAP